MTNNNKKKNWSQSLCKTQATYISKIRGYSSSIFIGYNTIKEITSACKKHKSGKVMLKGTLKT